MQKGWALFVLAVAGGCGTYQPMPITAEAVRARLQPPGMGELRILASQIKHPILHPVELKPQKGLSPDEAAVIAVLLNPSLRAIRDQKAVAKAQLLDAGLLPNPELTYSLGLPTGNTAAGAVTAYGLGLNWDVTSLISRASRMSVAKAHKEAVDLDIAWQEWQIAQAAKAAVYQLFSLQKQIALAEKASRHMVGNLGRIRDAVANGFMTASVLNTAQVASRYANDNLRDLEKRADQERLQLRRLLGLPAATQIRLSNDIHLPSLVELPAGTLLFEGLAQRRLDLLALRRGYDSQEAAVRAAVLERFPKIGVGPTIGRDTDNIQTVGFGLNIELPILDHNQGRIAREKATRQKLFDEYVNRVSEARSDIELILSGIRFTNEQIAATRASESNLRRLVKNYRAALVEGRTDALTYYAIWNELISARTKVITLEGRLAQAAVALELASGFYEVPKPAASPKATPKHQDKRAR